MGIAAALVFCSKYIDPVLPLHLEITGWSSPIISWPSHSPLDLGAAYGTAKSGVGICSMGVLKPDLIFKSIVPIIMAGILGIYGLIVAVILNGKGKLESKIETSHRALTIIILLKILSSPNKSEEVIAKGLLNRAESNILNYI